MLSKLLSACLLQFDDEGYLHVHEMVRKMAFQILNETLPSIVDIGTEEIKYLPDKWHYMENILRISFTGNDSGVRPNYLARCPNVSTLLLLNNEKLDSIEDTFFYGFQGLKVLNLSRSGIVVLPISVCCLKELRGLFLNGCSKLRDIPSLAKLESLQVLNLSFCLSVREVPEGVELLSNLKYLDLTKSGIDDFGAENLARLIHLEFLAFDQPSNTLLTKNVARLPKLESLYGCFSDIGELYTYFSETKKRRPIQYYLSVEPYGSGELGLEFFERSVLLRGCNISKKLVIQKDTQMLTIRKVSIDKGSGLCFKTEIALFSDIELQFLDIGDVEDMEYLFNVLSSRSILQSVETVSLANLNRLHDLFGRERDDEVPQATTIFNSAFFNLKSFTISCCGSIKKLFVHSLLANLRNLEKIDVKDCSEMEEIIAAPEQESSNSAIHSNFNQTPQLSLPKLKILELKLLPKLKSVCSAQIKCESLGKNKDIQV